MPVMKATQSTREPELDAIEPFPLLKIDSPKRAHENVRVRHQTGLVEASM